MLRRFRSDERGATAIEYGLVCGIIAVAVLTIAATGGALDTLYNQVLIKIASALGGGGGGGGGDGG